MTVRVSIGGLPEEPRNVLFDEWQFGKATRPAAQLHSFQLLVERGEFVAWVEPIYEEMIREFREDDKVGGFTPEYEGQVGYPSLMQLFDLPRDSRMSLLRYLRFDILGRYLGAPYPHAYWMGMSIDDISIDDDWLRVDGKVCRAPGTSLWERFLSSFR
ncbi:hypothetical protein [Brevundimonas sp.]|jgi:hypothetical protein|uniref:hypothetical protein n=1 Tax=Brevundimonas sp. TaxID=1871086 RepID=UPI002ED9718F